MTADTRTTERTETRVETVTVEEVQCPVCQQWYAEGEELTVVGVGVDYEPTDGIVDADHLTRVCTSCAASLFDIEVSASGGRLAQIKGALSRPVVDIDIPTSAVRTLVSIGITLTVAGIVASVGLEVTNQVATQVEASDVQEVGAPAFTPVEMVPMVLLVMLVALVTRLPGVFGGRFSR
jgi:carbon monoxide dehydrogenase subunit G